MLQNPPVNEPCPCGSGMDYKDCCGVFHLGARAPTAVQLMRSRYSAYAKRQADYIIKTTHPRNPAFKQDAKKWKKEILKFCDSTQFKKLEILGSREEETAATVTFRAHLATREGDYSYIEMSAFEKIDGAWTYLNGKFLS